MKVPPLYTIIDHPTCVRHGWGVPELAHACLEGGARLLQLRAPQVGGAQLLDWCEEIVETVRRVGARVIVNDRVDIARLAKADGVHVGQTDLEVSAVRQLLPDPVIIGLSTHTPRQIDEVPSPLATYVAVGPVFATDTKDTGYDTVGLPLVRYAANTQPLPVVAIGGVTLDRAPAVLEAGASSVAVISDLFVGGEPARRVSDYVARLGA